MNSRHKLLTVAALAVWTVTAATASAQTTLRYKLKVGDTLRYTTEQKMKMTSDVLNMTTSQTSDMTWTVQSVDSEGNAKVGIKLGRNKVTMDGPQGKTEVDSDAAQEPDDAVGQVVYRVIKALSGLEVTGTLSSSGKLSDINVPEKALKELENLPAGQMFGEMLSKEGIKTMMSQSGLVMPTEPVEKGKSWKSKSEMKMPFGKMIAEVDYTYAGPFEKDGRTLEKITLKPKATIQPDPKSPISIKLKSHEGTGAALFDNAAGRLLEITNQQTMEMELDIMGMTINQRVVQSMTMRLVDKK